MGTKQPTFLLAKPGLDGHDKGVRLVAMALREAGVRVVYLGLRQSVDDIAAAALREKADFIGLSVLSGVHLKVADKMLKKMAAAGIAGIPLAMGGIISPQDQTALKEMGVAAVFPVNTKFEDIVQWTFDTYQDRNQDKVG